MKNMVFVLYWQRSGATDAYILSRVPGTMYKTMLEEEFWDYYNRDIEIGVDPVEAQTNAIKRLCAKYGMKMEEHFDVPFNSIDG